jgi:hypothetical protein
MIDSSWIESSGHNISAPDRNEAWRSGYIVRARKAAQDISYRR